MDMGVSFREAKTPIKGRYKDKLEKEITSLIERNRSQYLDSAQVTID
jgi:hypothetical protein